MRIVLDFQGAQTPGSRNRGIGRYSLSLAEAMARAAGPKIDIRIALNADFPDAAEAIVASARTGSATISFFALPRPSGHLPTAT